MLRRAVDWLLGADMELQPEDPDRPPYPLIFPSDWACFWDLGYLLAEARRRSDTFDASDLSDD
jgi:hypothetical protein